MDDKAEGKIGYVFFYPSKDKTFMIEKESGEAGQKQLKVLEQTICELLYAIHKQKDPQHEDLKENISKWCLHGTPELIYQSKDLFFIIPDQEEAKQADPEANARNVNKH